MSLPSTPGRSRLGPLIFLANRGYRGTWIAGGIVSGVRWLEVLAASVFVFQLTASPFSVSLVMLARLAPNMLLGGLIGTATSFVSRERLMAIGFIGLGVTRLVLAVLVLFGIIEVWQVMLGMFISGIIDASEFPVRRSLAGDYVGPEEAHRALTFDQFSNVFTMATGPVAGGYLLDWIGLHGAYFVGAALNVVGTYIALTLPPPPNVRLPARAPVLSTLVEGWRYIRSQRILVGAMVLTLIFNTFTWPFTTMIPVVGREELGLSAGLIGVLMAMLGVGSFIANLTLSLIRRQVVAPAYFLGVLIGTVGVLLFSMTTTFEAALIVMLLTGIGVGGFSSNQGAVVFINSAPQYRAQTMGLLTMAIGIAPLGILHIGILSAWIGAPLAMAVCAIEGLIAIAISFFIWPELRGRPQAPPGPGAA